MTARARAVSPGTVTLTGQPPADATRVPGATSQPSRSSESRSAAAAPESARTVARISVPGVARYGADVAVSPLVFESSPRRHPLTTATPSATAATRRLTADTGHDLARCL